MDGNCTRRMLIYKGCVVEYTGVPDDENPIGLYFDKMRDAQHILISASVSPFLMEAVAEAIIDKDGEAIENILIKSGLKKPKSQLSARLEMELFEICSKKEVKF